MQMIPVDRGSRVKALHSITKGAQKAIAEGRQILIYPEGTRRAPGAPPHYKYGIVHLYEALNLPVLPIAHNAGLYWPRRKFLRYPGTIRCPCAAANSGRTSEKEEFLTSLDRNDRDGLRRTSGRRQPRHQSHRPCHRPPFNG
jgi:1-acyl-sn-glycerol-3-phosphate acyltransferase